MGVREQDEATKQSAEKIKQAISTSVFFTIDKSHFTP